MSLTFYEAPTRVSRSLPNAASVPPEVTLASLHLIHSNTRPSGGLRPYYVAILSGRHQEGSFRAIWLM